MKKQTFIIPIAIIAFFLFSIFLVQLVLAETPNQIIQQQVGFNPSSIPTSQQDVNNIASKYLKQEWAKVIATTPIIAPIHAYFLAHPLIFQILLNYPYEISLTFFLILFLWIFFAIIGARIFRSIGILGSGLQNAIIGIGISVILAHVNILKNLTLLFLSIAISDKAWWIRLLLWVGLFLFAWFFALISVMIERAKIKKQKQQKDADTARKAEKADQFIKSAEEGNKMKASMDSNTRESNWKRFLGYGS